MRRKVPRTRRSRSLLVIAAVAIGALIWVVGAFADAGNPIVGTIKGSLVKNTDGTVTVYVRGQWNWLTHGSDCNVDRAGAGAAFIWNDPNEPGYPISGTTASGTKFTAGVGVAKKLNGDTLNNIDGTAHPADLGNVPESKPGNGGTFFDSTSGSDQPAGAAHPYTTWKGGCGREPLSDTAAGPVGATFPTSEASGTSCADGSTDCNGHPWGSWGYFKGSTTDASTTGYSHTYMKRSDVTTVCVDFYDVHGKNQVVGGTKEIDVLGNGDNSIQTNKFDPTQGANCVSFPFIDHTSTNQTPCVGTRTIGDSPDTICDVATIGGASSTQKTWVQFHLWAPGDTTCSGTDLYSGSRIAVTGNSTATSDAYEPGPPNGAGTGAYHWTAELFSAASGGTKLDSTKCGDTGETSQVNSRSTTTDTGQKLTIHDHAFIDGFLSGGTGGTVQFQLYDNLTACNAHQISTVPKEPIFDETDNLGTNGQVDSSDFSLPFTNTATTYYWYVTYSGDTFNGNTLNQGSVSKCTESFSVNGNNLPAGVDP
jgi:hypothetical protein